MYEKLVGFSEQIKGKLTEAAEPADSNFLYG